MTRIAWVLVLLALLYVRTTSAPVLHPPRSRAPRGIAAAEGRGWVILAPRDVVNVSMR